MTILQAKRLLGPDFIKTLVSGIQTHHMLQKLWFLASTNVSDQDIHRQLGHFLNAGYLIAGDISVKNTHTCVNLRLIDIEKGVVIATASYDPNN